MKSLLLNFLFMFNLAAYASIQLESYSGAGCPDQTVTGVSSPDGTTLSVIFDQFMAEVPNYNENDNVKFRINHRGKKIDQNTVYVNHKLCDLIFSAQLPAGHRIESLEINVQSRGATILDPNVFARYSGRLIRFQGFNGIRHRKVSLVKRKNWGNLIDFTEEDWFLESEKSVPIQSTCTANSSSKAFFSFRNHLMVENREENESGTGFISLDTSDIKGFLEFKLVTSACTGVEGNLGSGRVRRPTPNRMNRHRTGGKRKPLRDRLPRRQLR